MTEVAREEDRGPAYANFIKQAVNEPSIVGVHWFQYLDQPATGRLLDGENGHFGLVGITDVPFQGFVESVRKSNLQAIELLGKAAEKAKVDAQQKAAKGIDHDGRQRWRGGFRACRWAFRQRSLIKSSVLHSPCSVFSYRVRIGIVRPVSVPKPDNR